MFKSYIKKYKQPSGYDAEKTTVQEGVYQGHRCFIRYATNYREAAGHPDFPYQIGVATRLRYPCDDGLTTDEEAKELWEIEDKLEKAICMNDAGFFVMTITTNGMREFIFYVKEWIPAAYEEMVVQINKEYPKRELQFLMQKDEKWNNYLHFIT